ncbi:uncharacterized protein LOC101852676 [Aplysia californica]|uniref:Uncharacterized protein LOC101852676 n=1 Tax=Aplysia californica TaxID=6500 RepID=A0ABM1VPU2_APLCA|nr:uncharacterized protein LOC101852676 [Aplysia californica]
MTQYNSSTDSARGWLAAAEHAGGPRIVAMDKRQTQHQEAYYLFFVASLGMALNLLVMAMIFVRRPLRRMTSAFLAHAAFLNLIKAAFCIPFGLNLLSGADGTDENQPQDCNLQVSLVLVYQAFCFIAWTQALVEPIILIFFDRNINLLSRFMYCDREGYTASQIAYLMSQARREDAATSAHGGSIEMVMGDAAGGAPGDAGVNAMPLLNLSRDSGETHAFAPLGACRHCSPAHSSPGETTPLRPSSRSRSHGSPQTSSTTELRAAGAHLDPLTFGDNSFEMEFTPLRVACDPIAHKEEELGEEDVQC